MKLLTHFHPNARTTNRRSLGPSPLHLATCIGLGLCLPSIAQATENISTTATGPGVDGLWVLMAACMVFFMQAGFLIFEVGAVRPLSATSVAMKNLIDWVMVSLVFVFVGFGLMFGHTAGGIVGTELGWSTTGAST